MGCESPNNSGAEQLVGVLGGGVLRCESPNNSGAEQLGASGIDPVSVVKAPIIQGLNNRMREDFKKRLL